MEMNPVISISTCDAMGMTPVISISTCNAMGTTPVINISNCDVMGTIPVITYEVVMQLWMHLNMRYVKTYSHTHAVYVPTHSK